MWMTFYVIVIIALTDTFGMLVGTSIGRHQLTKISPKKTIEGSVGSLVLVTLVAIAATWVPQLHLQWWQGAVLGLFTGIAAQVGDLVESAFKRDAGVKDAGAMIQGHGGVLDRFDSYFLGGVTFFATLHLLEFFRFRDAAQTRRNLGLDRLDRNASTRRYRAPSRRIRRRRARGGAKRRPAARTSAHVRREDRQRRRRTGRRVCTASRSRANRRSCWPRPTVRSHSKRSSLRSNAASTSRSPTRN